MSRVTPIPILPYSLLVGQEQLRLALELAYVAPAIGGVLISGQRGTGKSTAVRAFAQMMYDDLPVTLPINATEDRVIGGWQIGKLLHGEPLPQAGLLEAANGKLLFIDEVNLLDDHIVNIILDVTAMGILVIQREERNETKQVDFTLVGTMTPDEGWLRPQLLDRFGLAVSVEAETEDKQRAQILETVVRFEHAQRQQPTGKQSVWIEEARQANVMHKAKLEAARQSIDKIKFPGTMAQICVQVAKAFNVIGHRADLVMARAAQAYAALQGAETVTKEHILQVAPMALMHRRPDVSRSGRELWTKADSGKLMNI